VLPVGEFFGLVALVCALHSGVVRFSSGRFPRGSIHSAVRWTFLRGIFSLIALVTCAQGQVGASAMVTGVEHQATADRIRVVVHFDRPVRFLEGTAADPDRIFFDLQGTRPADALLARTTVGDSPLRRIRVSQYQPGITRVVLDVDRLPAYSAAFLTDPPRLVVEISRAPTLAETRILVTPVPGTSVAPEKPADPAITQAAGTAPPAAVAAMSEGSSVTPFDGRLASRIGAAAFGDAGPLLQAAQHGDSNAQFQMGDLFMTGHGVTRDPTAAASWYRAAAQQGHAVAAGNLGVLYANGWGVPQNDAEAAAWFQKAADAGDSGGQNNLGAMYIAGRGVAQSDALGAKWLSSAAQLGVAEAQYALGTLYANGRGVARDDAQAVKWLKAAAAQGYAPSQIALGKVYVAGEGVPRDYAEAMRDFRSANTPEAWYQLGLMYQQGLGVEVSEAEAAIWWLKAAQRGSMEAQLAMGRLYQDRDPVEAYSWFSLAAAGGDQPGAAAMSALVSRLTPEQLSEAKRRAAAIAQSQQ